MKTTSKNISSFEPVWEALRETDQLVKELSESHEDNTRLIRKNLQLIKKLGRQKRPNARYIMQQLDTMCYL